MSARKVVIMLLKVWSSCLYHYVGEGGSLTLSPRDVLAQEDLVSVEMAKHVPGYHSQHLQNTMSFGPVLGPASLLDLIGFRW